MAGPGVLYFARLSARRTQSRMSRIVGTPEYQLMTIRSWTTTTKLLGLLEARTRRVTGKRIRCQMRSNTLLVAPVRPVAVALSV